VAGGPHALWKGIADGSRFYFVHSYYCEPAEPRSPRRDALPGCLYLGHRPG
jgi:imidazoleglycerol phosphate synthase glutamine amidotransferase subunit HisH